MFDSGSKSIFKDFCYNVLEMNWHITGEIYRRSTSATEEENKHTQT
jgi:hypothetical protein